MAISCENVHATIGEFQRQYIYKLYLETIPEGIDSSFSGAQDFQTKIDLYNEKAVFPDRKTNAITIKWGGEFFDIPGTDGSTRNYEFSFYDDEEMKVYSFFSACKDLTGNDINQACVVGPKAKFDIGVAKVSVDKDKITAYRRLKGCRVYSVKSDDISKSADGVSKITVEIRWDYNRNDATKVGQSA